MVKIRNKVAGWKMKLLSQGGCLVLLRHVLSSMATHLLSVLNVPKVIFTKLNSILSTFCRGDINGRPRMKWCAWTNICKPIKEGEFGLRDFSEVQSSLHMKFEWRLLSIDNLWTQFFKAKYIKHGHIVLASTSNTRSRFWKSISQVVPEVLDNSKWRVREGISSFGLIIGLITVLFVTKFWRLLIHGYKVEMFELKIDGILIILST